MQAGHEAFELNRERELLYVQLFEKIKRENSAKTTGLYQERAYTYSGISCPECVHKFFCCLLMHIMHFVCKLQVGLNVDTKVYAFKFM